MYTGNFPQEAARPPLVIDTTREFGTDSVRSPQGDDANRLFVAPPHWLSPRSDPTQALSPPRHWLPHLDARHPLSPSNGTRMEAMGPMDGAFQPTIPLSVWVAPPQRVTIPSVPLLPVSVDFASPIQRDSARTNPISARSAARSSPRSDRTVQKANEEWDPALSASPRLGITTRPPRSLIDLDGATVLRVSTKWAMKSLAGALAGRMRKYEEVVLHPEQGLEHLNHCVKSLCVARTFLKPNTVDIYVRVEWTDENGLAMLCQSRFWTMEQQAISEDIKVRIAGKTAPPAVQTAGLIANRLREHGMCFVFVMGADAVLQALRAMCLVHNFVTRPAPVWFQPKFITVERSVSNRSAIQMLVVQDP